MIKKVLFVYVISYIENFSVPSDQAGFQDF